MPTRPRPRRSSRPRNGQAYRMTVEGPGVTPDVKWQGKGPPRFNPRAVAHLAHERDRNAKLDQFGDRLCCASERPRGVMWRFPAGAVITVDLDGERLGLTLGTLVSLSLDPPPSASPSSRRRRCMSCCGAPETSASACSQRGRRGIAQHFARCAADRPLAGASRCWTSPAHHCWPARWLAARPRARRAPGGDGNRSSSARSTPPTPVCPTASPISDNAYHGL